jgi:hypothetical protein
VEEALKKDPFLRRKSNLDSIKERRVLDGRPSTPDPMKSTLLTLPDLKGFIDGPGKIVGRGGFPPQHSEAITKLPAIIPKAAHAKMWNENLESISVVYRDRKRNYIGYADETDAQETTGIAFSPTE